MDPKEHLIRSLSMYTVKEPIPVTVQELYKIRSPPHKYIKTLG